jgi:hypothetical protein
MTPAERGITNKDDLLLLEITDHHPVLLQFASAVMRQRGSAVPDSWVQEIMTGKSTVANAKRDTLDLETKKGCEKKKNALAYICWQGNPGAVHRDGLQNPPADIGVDAWHALQTDLDTYGKCVRDCIQAHQGGDTWKSSSSSTSKDKQWTWFLGLLYSKHWAVFSFQFTDELLMQMPRCKRDREQLAVERLESFRHAGHIDLDGTSSSCPDPDHCRWSATESAGQRSGRTPPLLGSAPPKTSWSTRSSSCGTQWRGRHRTCRSHGSATRTASRP